MKTQYLFCSVPYNLSDIPLGTLVPDPSYPTQNTLTAVEAKKDVDFTVRDQQNFEGSLDSSKSTALAGQLTKLLQLSRSKSTSKTLDVSARAGSLYELRSPRTFFKLACAETSARKWLEEGIKQGDKSYFVVGLRTFVDADVGESKSEGNDVKGDTSIPAGQVVKANTGVSVGDAVDLKVSGEKSSSRASREAFSTAGERIFAICYSLIKIKRKSISDAVLEKENVWKLFTDHRVSGSDSSLEEWCEADIDDEVESISDLTENAKLIGELENVQYYLDEA